jgi:Putative restriction endonuclease
VRTVVLGPPSAELQALIARRRSLGLDRYDAVWDGEYHMAPMAQASHGWLDHQLAVRLDPLAKAAGLIATGAFNLGEPGDFRVPDRGLHRVRPDAVWLPTAALVVEIESPDDETWEKLGFYARHHVDEVLIVSAVRRSIDWLIREGEAYERSGRSHLLGAESSALTNFLEWPSASGE